MPASSKAQQRFMGLVRAVQKGEVPKNKVSKAIKKVAKDMKAKEVDKYASTKHKNLPDKVDELVPNMAVINQPAYKKMLDKQISKNTKIKTALSNKDHKDHKKAKSIMQRIKDKLMKKKPIRLKSKSGMGKISHLGIESVNEYTYGVGDIVKDINPTCPHNGAMGKVKSISPKSVVFVVMNKGKNYQPGDVLDKTHDQMKKMNEISNSEAKELLRQLGGRRFMMMVGAKNIARDKDGLHMKIGRNSKSISHVVIDYNRGRDLYDMKFLRVRSSKGKMNVKVVKQVKGIYADQLHDTFEKHTGLYTRM